MRTLRSKSGIEPIEATKMRFHRNQLGHDEVRDGTNKTWDLNKAPFGLMGISQATTIGVYIYISDSCVPQWGTSRTIDVLAPTLQHARPARLSRDTRFFQPKTVEIWATVRFLWFLNCLTGNSTFQNPL